MPRAFLIVHRLAFVVTVLSAMSGASPGFSAGTDPDLVIEDEKAALQLSPMDVSDAYMHTVTGLALPVQDVSDPKGHALAAFEASYRFQNADWYCFLLLAISLIRHGQIERARR